MFEKNKKDTSTTLAYKNGYTLLLQEPIIQETPMYMVSSFAQTLKFTH